MDIPDLGDLPQLIANSLLTGSILAICAIGFTLTYKILNFVNVAHGDLIALGAYVAWLLNDSAGMHLVPAILVSAAFCAVVGMGLDKIIWKPMRNRRAGRITLIIISIGLAFIVRSAIIFVWGGGMQKYDLPLREGYHFLGVVMTLYEVIILLVAVALMVATHFLLRRTKIGKAMRALSDNMDLARVSGIDVDRVILWTWAIGIGLAAVAGAMFGLDHNVKPDMGWELLIPFIAAAILGGAGNIYGAMLGGLVLGLAMELTALLWGPEFKYLGAFAILFAVLLVRPQGILGETGK